MSVTLYLPPDAFSGNRNDPDLAADYLELTAFFSSGHQAFSQSITDALELAAEEDYKTIEEELQACDVLAGTPVYPTADEIRDLRNYFQYLSTAGLAAEIGGPAWSFGHPRPDGTGFIRKLTEIWNTLRDGRVNRDPSAPTQPKDDQVDVFAWREHRDGLPGFLLAAAQVATGANWKEKSVKTQVAGVFAGRWFNPQPVTTLVPYHIVPFARPDDKFRDDVLVLGNILHRLRLPFRVMEAEELAKRGVAIEAFDELPNIVAWLQDYQRRGALA